MGGPTAATTTKTTGSSLRARRKEAIISRREIEGMIADGRLIFIFDGQVIKADAWLNFHPGGDKAIRHMVGRDATDEINAYVLYL